MLLSDLVEFLLHATKCAHDKQAVSVVDPETAIEEARRSAQYHRDHASHGDPYRRVQWPLLDYNDINQLEHNDRYDGTSYAQSLQVPLANTVQSTTSWSRVSPERLANYPLQNSCRDGDSSESGYRYNGDYAAVQPPRLSHLPSETSRGELVC